MCVHANLSLCLLVCVYWCKYTRTSIHTYMLCMFACALVCLCAHARVAVCTIVSECGQPCHPECTKIAHRRSLAIFTADEGIAGNSAARTVFTHFLHRRNRGSLAIFFLRQWRPGFVCSVLWLSVFFCLVEWFVHVWVWLSVCSCVGANAHKLASLVAH